MVEFQCNELVGGREVQPKELKPQQAGTDPRLIGVLECGCEFAAGGVELIKLQKGDSTQVVNVART